MTWWILKNMMTSSNWNISQAICVGNSPVTSDHAMYKGQWSGALMFSLICTWMNSWVNNREAGDLRRHSTHCNVTVMKFMIISDLIQMYTCKLLFTWNICNRNIFGKFGTIRIWLKSAPYHIHLNECHTYFTQTKPIQMHCVASKNFEKTNIWNVSTATVQFFSLGSNSNLLISSLNNISQT